MKRRDFVSFGTVVTAWPLAVRAQKPDRKYRFQVPLAFDVAHRAVSRRS